MYNVFNISDRQSEIWLRVSNRLAEACELRSRDVTKRCAVRFSSGSRFTIIPYGFFPRAVRPNRLSPPSPRLSLSSQVFRDSGEFSREAKRRRKNVIINESRFVNTKRKKNRSSFTHSFVRTSCIPINVKRRWRIFHRVRYLLHCEARAEESQNNADVFNEISNFKFLQFPRRPSPVISTGQKNDVAEIQIGIIIYREHCTEYWQSQKIFSEK